MHKKITKIIVISLCCIYFPAHADWMSFFNEWSAFNANNRRAFLGLEDTSPTITTSNGQTDQGSNTSEEPAFKLSDIKGGVPQQIYDLRNFLKDKQAFLNAGALPPRGILLVGPPGTGKTTIVRALAAELNIPLVATSATSFVELYVGSGPKAVRELFENARTQMIKNKAEHVIIFIDEIDGIGSRNNSYASTEDHKTINELLNQMDGFAKDSSITVIAATNYAQRLDPALLRPGRFDEIITIGLPDYKARMEILKMYIYSPKFNRSLIDAGNVLEHIARNTEGFSGAELESIVNKAAIAVARDKRASMTQDDLVQAYAQVKAMRTNRGG